MVDNSRRQAVPNASDVAETLLRVRAAVRQQHALVATIPDDTRQLLARLEEVQALQVLEEPVPHSHRGWFGRPISQVKRAVYRLFTKQYLQPLMHRQNTFNRAVTLALQELAERQVEVAQAMARETVTREVPERDPSGKVG